MAEPSADATRDLAIGRWRCCRSSGTGPAKTVTTICSHCDESAEVLPA